MSGYTLGQESGHGHTFQLTIIPGTSEAAVAPAAGASYSYTIQPWDRMRLVFATFTLATDANAANRYVTVEYAGSDGVSVLADGAPVLVTANTTAQRFIGSLRRGPAEWNTGTDVFFPLSGIWLEVGRSVVINVAGVQAGDQLSKIRLTFDATPVRGDGSEASREAGWERDLRAEIAAAAVS